MTLRRYPYTPIAKNFRSTGQDNWRGKRAVSVGEAAKQGRLQPSKPSIWERLFCRGN